MSAVATEALEKCRFRTGDFPVAERREIWHDFICSVHFGMSFDTPNWNGYFANIDLNSHTGFQVIKSHGAEATLRREIRHINRDDNDVFEFLLPAKGSVTIEQNHKQVDYSAGQIAFIDATKPFVYSHKEPFSGYFFMVPRDVLVNRIPMIEALCGQSISCQMGQARIAAEFFKTVANEIGAMSPIEYTSATRHLLEMLVLMMEVRADVHVREGDRHSALLATAKMLVSNHITSEDLGVDLIATHLGCSVRYVQMVFRSSGTTVSAYIRERRLKYARELLRSALYQSLSITEIALHCCFSSSSHFGAAFKARFAMTPQEFRRAAETAMLPDNPKGSDPWN